jgi:cardiolipin synthase A/B
MVWLLYTLLAALQVAALLSAIHALFTVRTPQGTIAWVVGLIAFPLLAVPLYWFFGSRRFDTHAQVMARKFGESRDRIAAIREAAARYRTNPDDLRPPEAATLTAIAGLDFLRGNKLELLIDGEATFDAILAEIATARRSILVQFYIVRPDGLGQRLLEALAARAADGVEVCFLYDQLGSAGLKRRVAHAWTARGVRMVPFCAFSGWRDRWRLNFRNHRKNVVIDGRVGFIGGHNVGDEYLGLNPKFGRWRDTHVRVEGPTALELQMSFAADWYYATGDIINAPWQPTIPSADHPDQRALVLDSGPSDQDEKCTLFFLHVISMARRRLWIASPYFVPDEGILMALELAALRGVEVRILLPAKADHLLVWLASFAMLKELDQPGIHIHRFTGGFLHQKALVVDEDFAAVGTANFDNRSFRLNFEITLAVADARFATETAAMFERDFAESEEVNAKAYDDLPWRMKIGAKVARLLAPIL